MVEPDLGQRAGFLPAIEVFGEGVFLRINEEALREWESRESVRARASILRSRLSGSFHAKWIVEETTPRLLLIHTLGHLLMRQMSFDAGLLVVFAKGAGLRRRRCPVITRRAVDLHGRR